MHLVGRRNFVKGLGLGAGATLLGPLCTRIVREAQGQAARERRFLFVTQGNAWNHSGDSKGQTGASNTGQKSAMFRAGWRSPADFDLPTFAEALAPFKKEIAIWFGLTITNTSPANHGPAGNILIAGAASGADISIDRWLARELKKRYSDVHEGTLVGPVCVSYGGKNIAAPSYDGAGRRTDGYMTPVKAYAAYFGSVAGVAPQQVQANTDLEKSLLDGMREDLARVKRRLAGTGDLAKFDQAVESLRQYELKLQALGSSARLMAGKPPAPPATLDKSGMDKEVLRALEELTVQVHSFGLTHVSHYSMHGAAAFDDDNWKPLAGPTFNNYGQNHNGLFHTENDTASESVRMMNRFMAGEIAWMRGELGKVRVADGTLADETVIVWIVQGGLRHHGGSDAQLVFLLAGDRTRVKAPHWIDFFLPTSSGVKGGKHMGQAYVSLAHAADLPLQAFGAGQGPLPDVLRA
jgi:hypothetical protein